MNWGHLSVIEIIICVLLLVTLVLDIVVWIEEIKRLRSGKTSDNYKLAKQRLPDITMTSVGSVLIIITCFIQIQPLRLALNTIACILVTISLVLTVRRSKKKKENDEEGDEK